VLQQNSRLSSDDFTAIFAFGLHTKVPIDMAVGADAPRVSRSRHFGVIC